MRQALLGNFESPGYPLGIQPPSEDFMIIMTPWGERIVSGRMITTTFFPGYPPELTDEQITLGS